jgi:hypothetical protein
VVSMSDVARTGPQANAPEARACHSQIAWARRRQLRAAAVAWCQPRLILTVSRAHLELGALNEGVQHHKEAHGDAHRAAQARPRHD